ncbi:hypothetical protein Sango_1370500 [Sesamum angolense]|uniref:Uncharacterized protein n=1 Tax=Sesamum angolense TaxID=2727404 RepID=A0AAE1WSV6_9LAMI|nr:hypothetical protein Sango_1370500 [Sesamum angolense]
MGNCCRREPAVVWASLDGWDVPEHEAPPPDQPPVGKEWLPGEDSRAPAATKEKVKIKITKRELEELVANARMQDVPVDRVFSRLIKAVDFSNVQRQSSWAPTLRTIAE